MAFFRGDYELALEAFESVLEKDRECMLAWKCKADTLMKLNRCDEALECYDRALEIDPTQAKIWYSRARTLEKLGSLKEALESLDKALKVDPELDFGISARALLLRKLEVKGIGENEREGWMMRKALRSDYASNQPIREESVEDRLASIERVIDRMLSPTRMLRQTVRLDKDDKKIVLACFHKARSVPQISSLTGIPIATCHAKVAKLEANSIIKRVRTIMVLKPVKKRITLFRTNIKQVNLLVDQGHLKLGIRFKRTMRTAP